MKKIMIVAFVFAIALTASTALATDCGQCGPRPCPCPDQYNSAYKVDNSVSADSVTGGNYNSYVFGTASIHTGAAGSTAYGINAVNSNLKTGMSWRPSAQTNKAAKVSNNVSAISLTGQNYNTYTGCATIATGAAGSTVKGINLVNTNVKIGCPCFGQPSCGCDDAD